MKTLHFLEIITNKFKWNTTCFLCYKQKDNLVNIHEEFEIFYENDFCKVTLWDVINELVTIDIHDRLCDQMCQDCSMVIFRMYVKLSNYVKELERFSSFTTHLFKEVNKKVDMHLDSAIKQCRIDLIGNTDFVPDSSNQSQPLHKPESNETSSGKFQFIKSLKLQNNSELNKKNLLNKSTVCPTCGKNFKSPSILKMHIRSHSTSKCPYCEKVLKTNSHYEVHIRQHTTGKKQVKLEKSRYRCENCEYVSSNKTTLEAHINRTHLNAKPYICGICSKGFYRKSNLAEHAIVHKKHKTETCEICGAHFVNRKGLINHLRLHTGEKPYKCEMCPESFVSMSRRTEHICRKHSEKSQQCCHCHKLFSLKRELNRHIKNVHNLL